jgi:hypothetical protein
MSCCNVHNLLKEQSSRCKLESIVSFSWILIRGYDKNSQTEKFLV